MVTLSNDAIEQLLTLALGGQIYDGANAAEDIYIDGVKVWPDEGMTQEQGEAGTETIGRRISAATLKAVIDKFDDSRGLHASRRIDYDLVKGWFDARGQTRLGIVQIIVGVYSAPTPTDRAKDIYIRSTAGTDVESGFTNWLTAQRYSLSGGVATADAMGGYRRAQDVTLPVGTMIQWLLDENGRDYVGRIFFGPGAGSPLSGSAGQIIANTVTSPRVYSPSEIYAAFNSLFRRANWAETDTTDLGYILHKPVPLTLEDLRNIVLADNTDARTISIAVLRQIIATTPPDIHGNERHNPDFAIASELLAEITNRIAADNAHRTATVINAGDTDAHPIHGGVVDGYWRDVSGYGDTLNMPVTFAAPTLTLGTTSRTDDAARFTSGNFDIARRRAVRWGFAFAGDTVYLGIVGYSLAPPAQGGQDGPSGQQSIYSFWRYNEIGLLQYSAAGAQVGTDTLWETYNPEQTTWQGADVLQGYIAGANIYWLMADQTGNGFSLTAYNLATGAYQTALSGDETRFGSPGKAARGAWGTAARQFICYNDGEIREYNPADGNLVRTFATLPAGSVSSAVPASGRLRGDANYLYALTGSSAATVGYVAYDLTTRERAPEKELAAFRLTSIADLWDFQVKPGPQGVAELYYSTLPTDYPTTSVGSDLPGYVSAQRSESYGVPTLGLVLERSDNLPPVEIDGFPVIGPRDANFVRAVYEALLRGDTAADGKVVGYDADNNAISLNVQERRPTLIFTPTTVGNDIVVAWRVAVPQDQADANFFRGSFRLNNVIGGTGGGGSSTFLGLTDVGESDYIGHGGELVKVNDGATGLEFGSELALSDDVPPAIAAAGSAGTGTEASRDDHTHAGITGAGAVLSDDVPPAIAAAGSAGTGTEASRDDHTHAGLQLSDATPGNTPGTAGPGTATTAARGDHDHGISPGRGGEGTTITYSTANPVNTATPSPGSSAAVARADHDHGIRVTQRVTVAAVAGDTLTGDGTTASPLGVRIPWHSSMVTELARVLQGTSPLAVAESGGLVNITAATLVSRLTAVETRLTALEGAGG